MNHQKMTDKKRFQYSLNFNPHPNLFHNQFIKFSHNNNNQPSKQTSKLKTNN